MIDQLSCSLRLFTLQLFSFLPHTVHSYLLQFFEVTHNQRSEKPINSFEFNLSIVSDNCTILSILDKLNMIVCGNILVLPKIFVLLILFHYVVYLGLLSIKDGGQPEHFTYFVGSLGWFKYFGVFHVWIPFFDVGEVSKEFPTVGEWHIEVNLEEQFYHLIEFLLFMYDKLLWQEIISKSLNTIEYLIKKKTIISFCIVFSIQIN